MTDLPHHNHEDFCTDDAQDTEHIEAMKMAVIINTVIALGSLASGLGGNSMAAVSEAIHDGSDATTHYLDYRGEKSANEQHSQLLRKISGVAIMSGAAVFAVKSGYEIAQEQARPETFTVYASWVVAAINVALHRYFHRIHSNGHSHGENFEASHTHAKWDAYVSPLLATGITLAQVPGLEHADDIAALAGAAMTMMGNLSPTMHAFRPNQNESIA
jgi:divalent metal cation (Fe/Co/Zn/Cd) transporter